MPIVARAKAVRAAGPAVVSPGRASRVLTARPSPSLLRHWSVTDALAIPSSEVRTPGQEPRGATSAVCVAREVRPSEVATPLLRLLHRASTVMEALPPRAAMLQDA